VKDVRDVLARAEQRLGEQEQGTILFLDEVHRFNKAQQDALLPSVESGLLVLIGATTENPYFEVNPPLLSRSTLFRLQPLDPPAVELLLHNGLEAEGAEADDEALAHLAERAGGDGRQALTSLEVAVALARARRDNGATAGAGGERVGEVAPRVTVADAEAALGTKLHRYGRDEHYDVISAFIKSVRGSDPQAALHYLARMLEAGEDARFIARRLVILASEDIGEADPLGLVVATAAAHAVEYVGLPEAQLNLAQAVVHLATAPKSNRAAMGIWRAREDVRNGIGGEVPVHLRDAHYRSARSLGHGVGYEYPHDDPRGWLRQQYLPDDAADAVYYQPSDHGFEQEIATRMERLAKQAGAADADRAEDPK
jgi:putative ATPase